jgi:hypothetical protein
MKSLFRLLVVTLTVLLLGGELYAAERGRGRNGGNEPEWYADPQRGWIKRDERRDRKEDRRDSRKDRRSDDKDRDRGRNRSGY